MARAVIHWPNRFYAGGRVLDVSHEVERVRLIGANRMTLNDTVDGGWVLFLTYEPMEVPLEVELYDGAGRIINRHPLFGRPG